MIITRQLSAHADTHGGALVLSHRHRHRHRHGECAQRLPQPSEATRVLMFELPDLSLCASESLHLFAQMSVLSLHSPRMLSQLVQLLLLLLMMMVIVHVHVHRSH